MKFKIKYSVADGYVGKDRPLYCSLDQSDIEEDMDAGDLEGLYYSAVQDDYENKVFPEGENLSEFLAWAELVKNHRQTE